MKVEMMEKNIRNLVKSVFAAILILGVYVAICITANGETLKVMTGVIEKCAVLGGKSAEAHSHATIKTSSGSYLISSVSSCSVGSDVTIFVKRGILYFNTIYVAEIK
ncbi:MAG: hypothetical protein ACJA1T_000016 [Zhongshania aliphaticivorans]|jgi:hypothetical protein|nr:hypothetical protein DOK_02771 [gamma proteobacterium BDW918]|tara:strand:- start:92902 stop:93222 length:321 start_codon:yes stop_codon:yes gene_type:complete